ncbi:hypothetical protein M885DRAFT_512029 [Pelagophyceae sp. CCMP2097]|nr:hypothetical protein M885DRAFT_512029 [Pelagophyceae sp. CCMP2097]|mmetsp:Transcript_6225/g.22193  ORF Transcript_6225/g.22193 Transcript_6225/m.22193 type:complete len:331 (+) Transcript_6225:92-1084(+)
MMFRLCVSVVGALGFEGPVGVLGPVGVIGGTGKLGRRVVQELAGRGVRVRVLQRHDVGQGTAASIADDASTAAVTAYLAALPGVELVRGDVTRLSDVEALLQGCTACISAHGARRNSRFQDLFIDPTGESSHSKQVNYVGVQNIIDAARSTGCERVVRVTGKGEQPWSVFSILINLLGSMAKAWNYEGEMLLRNSGLDYTLVRPGVMGRSKEDAPSSLALCDDGGDLKVSSITHGAVARLCVDCLDFPNAAKATLTAMTTEARQGAESWRPLLANVAADRREFPPSMLDQHQKAVKVGAAVALGAASSFALLVFFALRQISAVVLRLTAN